MEAGTRTLVLAALYVAVSLLTRWLSLVVEVLDVDEAAHAVGSWVLLDGGRLYADFVDNKPPLLYAYYALAQLAFWRGLFAVHASTALVTVPLTALALSRVFRHDRRGVAAALLWLVYGSAFLAHDTLAAHAELILLLPSAWAIALVAGEDSASDRRRLFLSGALLGIATLVKHQAAFWLPVLLWAARDPRGEPAPGGSSPRRVFALAAGFATPLVAALAAFAAAGGAHDLLYWLLWRNLLYAASPTSAGHALERAASYLLPWLLATAPLWWAWARSRGLFDPRRRHLVDGLVVLGLLPAFAGLRFFPHYFVPAVLALALGAAPAVAAWSEPPRRWEWRAFGAATVVIAAAFAAANAWLWLGPSRVYRERDPAYVAVAERLATDPCFRGSRLFVWGWAPSFYYEAGKRGARPGSRFAVLAQAGLTSYVPGSREDPERRAGLRSLAEPAHWDWLLSDLDRTRATYVLDTSTAWTFGWDRYPLAAYPDLARYVSAHYEPLGEVARVRVYRRRGCARP